MDRKNLLKSQAWVIFFVLVLNFTAHKFYWYYSIRYFDMLMHFLGGLWAGLAALYLFKSSGPVVSVSRTLLFVLVIGIGWEIFEILVNETITNNPLDFIDTFSDLLLDIAGGIFALIYFFHKILFRRGNTIQ